MSTYKLYYYDARGRAEAIRMLFAQAGVKYEDIRFTQEEWISKYKAGMQMCFIGVYFVCIWRA